jgi:hypothetical protein
LRQHLFEFAEFPSAWIDYDGERMIAGTLDAA